MISWFQSLPFKFNVRRYLEDLLDDPHVRHRPAANSVEWHPMYNDEDLRAFCAERGVTLTAYGTLPEYARPAAAGGKGGGAKTKKAREELERVARGQQGRPGTTPSQVWPIIYCINLN